MLGRLATKRYIKVWSLGNLLSYSRNTIVLGIETSCDDTGCAVIDETGRILGEALYSQNLIHLRNGGINPIIARDLHRENIETAVNEALRKSSHDIRDIDAIAITVKPGLLASLQIGVKYAKYIAKIHKKPIIPIHHMEAHALVARMYEKDIQFPFLVLLISGGHCLLAIVKDVDEFLLLGQTVDDAPGEAYDKVARRMKLKNVPEYSKFAGGRAVEMAATKATNPSIFKFAPPLLRNRDCNFSFSGMKASVIRKLKRKEAEHGINGDSLIPEVNDLCAAFQKILTEHLMHRTQRAMEFSLKSNLLSENSKTLIVSGGVACNNYIFESIKDLGIKSGFKVYRPPHNVCTDNGIMIAWNGIEKLKKFSIYQFSANFDTCDIEPQAQLGKYFIEEVKKANLPVRFTRIKSDFIS